MPNPAVNLRRLVTEQPMYDMGIAATNHMCRCCVKGIERGSSYLSANPPMFKRPEQGLYSDTRADEPALQHNFPRITRVPCLGQQDR